MSITERLKTAIADRYVIERELGQGGMATVYLAHDVKHDRKVALKVLKPELAAVIGAERFLAEIKTTANLQHPHILALHDSGEVNGTVFYVMPFVEGESLRDRLTREKQLPVAETVRIGREVASALDYAHRKGIVHRDIKPENILLHEGQALVADFGIALAASNVGGTRLTETGMSLGTPHYMSPEQAMGDRDLDARSDIYALGATIYEMLAGEPPFTGPTAQAIIARVLSEDPRPLDKLRPTVPAHVEAAVRMALQKLPADRFATAAQFAEALERPGTVAMPVAAPAPSAAGRYAPWAVAGLLGVLALAGWLRGGSDPASQPPSRLAVVAPGLGGSGGTALQRQLALTPGGDAVIYSAVDDAGTNVLMLRLLDAEESQPLNLLGNLTSPGSQTVSPDGRWLAAVTTTGRLYRFPIEGGGGNPLGEELNVTPFIAWTPDGALWATPTLATGEVVRIGPGDSITRRLEGFEAGIRMMQVLPDGAYGLIVLRGSGTSSGPVGVLDLESGEATTLQLPVATEARYTAGYLVYAVPDGTLNAVAFDARRHELTGTPVTIATGVSLTGTGAAQIAVAPNGTVAYIPEEPRSLVFVDRSGLVREATPEQRNFHAPVFSPDGRRLSVDFTSADGRDVWVLGLAGGTLTRATFDQDGHDATWTPDGRFLTYTSAKRGALGIYRTRPGTAERAESLLTTAQLGWTGVWRRDGSALVTVANVLREGSQQDIGVVTNGGAGPIEPLVASPYNETYPAISPDERWLAFVSDQSGQQEVYVRSLDEDGELVQVSRTGGNEPVWSPDGRELFYRGTVDGVPTLIGARVRTGPSFGVTTREPLFSLHDFVGTQPHPNYDVAPDGSRFAMVRRSPSTRIMVIQNLPGLVRRLRGSPGGAR